MARCMLPRGSHRARGGAPIAVRVASPVPMMILIAVGRGGPLARGGRVVCLLCRSSQSLALPKINLDPRVRLLSRSLLGRVRRL